MKSLAAEFYNFCIIVGPSALRLVQRAAPTMWCFAPHLRATHLSKQLLYMSPEGFCNRLLSNRLTYKLRLLLAYDDIIRGVLRHVKGERTGVRGLATNHKEDPLLGFHCTLRVVA